MERIWTPILPTFNWVSHFRGFMTSSRTLTLRNLSSMLSSTTSHSITRPNLGCYYWPLQNCSWPLLAKCKDQNTLWAFSPHPSSPHYSFLLPFLHSFYPFLFSFLSSFIPSIFPSLHSHRSPMLGIMIPFFVFLVTQRNLDSVVLYFFIA